MLLAAAAASVFVGAPGCAGDTAAGAPRSAAAERSIPAGYLTLYQQAGAAYRRPMADRWPRSARSNPTTAAPARPASSPASTPSAAAPARCSSTSRNGPPSTWQTYRVDGDYDGATDPYDPADAIASAGHYLHALLAQAHGDIASRGLRLQPLAGLRRRRARARPRLQRPTAAALTAPAESRAVRPPAGDPGPANLQQAERRDAPRAYAMLPA